MIKRFLLTGLLILGLAGLSYAAVEVTNGTTRTKTEQITISGAAMSVSGSDVTINTLTETGDKTITGDANVTGDLTVDTDIYGERGAFIDGSIYLTTAAPASAAGVGLYVSQPDGGCSKCYVDAAGTTWACADATCPPGM